MSGPTNEDLPSLQNYEQVLMTGLSADIYHAAAATFERTSNDREYQPDLEFKKFKFTVTKDGLVNDTELHHNILYDVSLPETLSSVFVSDSVRSFEIDLSTEKDHRPDMTIVLRGQADRTVTLSKLGKAGPDQPFDCHIELDSGNNCTGIIPSGDIALFLTSFSLDPVTRNKAGNNRIAMLDVLGQGVASLLLAPHIVDESYVRFDNIPVTHEDDTTVSLTQTITPKGETSYDASVRRTVRSERGTKRTTDEYALSLPAIEQGLEYLLKTYDHTQTHECTWDPGRPTIFQEEKYPNPSVLSYMIAAVRKANPRKTAVEPFEEYMEAMAEIDDAPAAPEEHEDTGDRLLSPEEACNMRTTNTAVIDALIKNSLDNPEGGQA